MQILKYNLNRPFVRRRYVWKNNIKLSHMKDLDCIQLAQDMRAVGWCKHCNEPSLP